LPWNFFALTLAYSWGLWLAAVALGGDLGSPIVGLLYAVSYTHLTLPTSDLV